MATIDQDYRHFHFFANKEITSLYITLGLFQFAEGLISIFIPIYFWQLGMSMSRIIFFYLLVSVFVILTALIVMPLLRRLSDKTMMISSFPFIILFFLGLKYIAAFPVLFFALPVVLAVNRIFFNVGYHLDFSQAADKGHVGEEVGMRGMVSSLVKLSAPFLGGLLITFFGFSQTFVVAAFIMLLAFLPLLFFPKRTFSQDFSSRKVLAFLKDKSLFPFNLGSFGYANEKMISLIVWPIFLFLAIGSINKFGGAVRTGFRPLISFQ